MSGAPETSRVDNCKISEASLFLYLRHLDYYPDKKEVEEIIWEVDEDHDRKLSWDEFYLSFVRCVKDTEGIEPQQLHNVILFSLFAGSAPILHQSELERLLYLKFGARDQVQEEMLHTAFGSTGGSYTLRMGQFVKGMRRLNKILSRKRTDSRIN
eukprot:jgi/Picsp_1/4188/NSC_01697-R1_hypothetical protein [Paramecium tetraurelia strain d4-2]